MARRRHVVILGGSGFVGRHLVARLLAGGERVTVLTRGLDARRRALLSRHASVRAGDVANPAFLRGVFEDADVVVNLVGILNERRDSGAGFEHVFVGLLDTLIEAMHASGLRRLLQMSALNAGRGDSHYLQARGRAERHLRDSGLDWTLFRPSVIAGPGDGLFCRFHHLLEHVPALPVGRADARFQPVWIGDVVEAYARALDRADSIGGTYELAGPDVLELGEIVRLTAQAAGRRRAVLALPPRLGRWQANVGELLPGKPISRDNWRSLQLDSVSDDDGLRRLGIEPTPVLPRIGEILAGCDGVAP